MIVPLLIPGLTSRATLIRHFVTDLKLNPFCPGTDVPGYFHSSFSGTPSWTIEHGRWTIFHFIVHFPQIHQPHCERSDHAESQHDAEACQPVEG
jgi:hypothetical protein